MDRLTRTAILCTLLLLPRTLLAFGRLPDSIRLRASALVALGTYPRLMIGVVDGSKTERWTISATPPLTDVNGLFEAGATADAIRAALTAAGGQMPSNCQYPPPFSVVTTPDSGGPAIREGHDRDGHPVAGGRTTGSYATLDELTNGVCSLTNASVRNAAMQKGWSEETRETGAFLLVSTVTKGSASFAGFLPGRAGVVVLTNIARDVSGLGADTLLAMTRITPEYVWRNPIRPGHFLEFAGRYDLDTSRTAVVRAGDDTLFIDLAGEHLEFRGAGDRFAIDDSDDFLEFVRNDAGRVTGLRVVREGTETVAPRDASTPPLAGPPPLPEYDGRYTVTAGFELRVTTRGSQHYLASTESEAEPLFRRGTDQFETGRGARIVFHRNEANEVDSLMLSRDRIDVPALRQGF